MNIPAGPGVHGTSPTQHEKSRGGCAVLIGMALFGVSLLMSLLGFAAMAVTNTGDNLGGFFGMVLGFFATVLGLGASGLFFYLGRTGRLARWLFLLPLCAPAAPLIGWMIYG